MTDHSAKPVMRRIKQLYREQKNKLESEDDISKDTLQSWHAETGFIYKEVNAMRKVVAASEERTRAEKAMLREEMRDELMLREATNARTAERFRAFAEQDQSLNANAFDRALRTASAIERSINEISRHTTSVNQGTVLLHRQATSSDPC